MASRTLPLFPLPVVLFPGAPLPLHIFEPRYRRLLADVLAGDREFGLLFQPEEAAEPAPGGVGCVAHVEESEVLPDGRANILVIGRGRFALRGIESADAPYYVGDVLAYEDEPEPAEALAPDAERLRALFDRVGRAARALADESAPLPALPDDPARLSFAVASMIDLDLAVRHHLLASRSPAERLRLLVHLLERSLAPIEERAAVHVRARGNGHGPTRSA